MTTTDLTAALSAAGLARVAPELAALAQPSIRLAAQPVDDDTLAPGASKLGGLPDLPIGAAWPYWKGAPLAFLAQIRLQDAQPYDEAHALPASGLLSFFYDARQQTYGDNPADKGSWQVIYSPGDQEQLQRTSAPPGLPPVSHFTPCTVTFASELTLPQQPELETPNWSWQGDEQTHYESFLSTFPTPQAHGAMHSRLLGYPDTIQDDMRAECQLAANGLTGADPRAAEVAQGANAWRLLFQVDSEPSAGMRWGSAGMLYFWIERDALAAKRFDTVWMVLQSD